MNNTVSYDIAYLAKQKGFNEEIDYIYCLGQWDAERQIKDPLFIAPKNSEMCGEEACSAPSSLELKKWLKSVHNLEVEEANIEEALRKLPDIYLKKPQEVIFI